MKKFTATMLAVLMISGSSLCLVGCGKNSPSRSVNDPDDAVATLTVFATGERGKVMPMLAAAGHAYTAIRNVSDSDITLGKGYVLPAGELVTIASWEFDAHGGIWYNIEPTYDKEGWFKGRKSVTRNIDAEGLDKLNAFLSHDTNDVWTILNNCTNFAIGAWNSVADGDELTDTLFPSNLENQIMRFEEYETGKDHSSELPIGYFSGDSFIRFTVEEEQ